MGLERSFVSSCVLCFLVLFPVLCSSQDPFGHSRATYYGSRDSHGTPAGACGYGKFGRNANGGQVSGVSRLYKNGTGCGACYKVRCMMPKVCTEEGANIVVTDLDQGESDRNDFTLSVRAYAKLALPNLASKLMTYGVLDVEYKRVPCQYPGHNLQLKVHERSRYPEYLALVMLFQAGQKEITAVELWQEEHQKWRPMGRANGAIWDTHNTPRGALSVRLLVSGYAEGEKWVQLRSVIPSSWKAGVAYNSAIQLD